MTKHSSIAPKGSLLERAADIYDFGAALRGRAAPAVEIPADMPPSPPVYASEAEAEPASAPVFAPVTARAPDWTGPIQPIDRAALAQAGFIQPDGPVTALSEEYRVLKRALLARLADTQPADRARGNRILVCSAFSGEGKTFTAINLALSLAAEKDHDVLLVDADFGKPGIPQALGLTSGPGLMDALADPAVAIEDCVLRTDIPSLAILPAGQRSNDDTEYLASARTDALLARLTQGRPDRIILFDSPPLLAASAAGVLASHAAIALLVVRADSTPESALRDAAGLLKGGAQVQLMLNGVQFAAGGRRFGSYYTKGS